MSRGITGFVKERLAQALAARRLSQNTLAAMVGVSPPTVSKWRSGDQAPEPEALERLASVVALSSEWFTRRVHPTASQPLFRSRASVHASARLHLETRLEWAHEFASALTEFVDFPDVVLPTRAFENPNEITESHIEEAADELRILWRLGRREIPDLVLAAESAGIIIVRELTEITKVEGLSAWSGVLARPLVHLSADKANAFRGRFDLAHEIGHLILHKHIPSSVAVHPHNYKLMEQQAHRFAGALLLPAETFASEIRTPITLDSLLLLKARWGVSVGAIIMRLVALSIIGDEQKQSLFKRRSARWGAKSEPGDDARAPEKPRLLKRTIELLVTSGSLTLESIPRYFGLASGDIEALAGLPERYFNGSAEVIELAKLRNPSSNSVSTSNDTQPTGNVVQFRNKNKK